MSLLKLLTTGKSLVGLKDAESRYRMTNQRLLPKFGSAKNPFSAAETVEPVSTVATPPIEEQQSAPVTHPTTMEPASNGTIKESAGLLRLGTSKARGLAAAALQTRWVSQLGPLISRPARKTTKAAGVPVPSKPQQVQGELSLDRIKVMRNDLSDADLEIIAARPKTRSVPAPALRAKDAVEPAAVSPGQPAEPMLSAVNR